MYTKQERKQYNEYRDRACQKAGITKNQYNWLRRKGEELRKIYEDDCNFDFSDEREQREKMLYDRILSYIKPLKLSIYYQTDPRGATIYIDKQPIPDNNYTQAICIY